jgi:hypothetical protein
LSPLNKTLKIDLFILVVLSLLLFNNNKTITNLCKNGLKSSKKTLEVLILCYIAEGNYKEALSITKEEIKKGNIGSFAKYDENGVTGINEYLEKYLMAKLRDVSS